MQIRKTNFVGMVVVLALLAVGILLMGWWLMEEREEKELLRTGKCIKPSRVRPCLVLEFPNEEQNLSGAVFDEGQCSYHSQKDYCWICDRDLTSEGRKKLMKLMLED